MMAGRPHLIALCATLLLACGEDHATPVHPELVPPVGPYDFGTVPVLNERMLEVDLRNVGRANLAVFSMRIKEDGAPFRVDVPPPEVGRGAMETVTVFFKPTSEQPFAATLVLETNDPNDGLLELPLVGVGDTRAVMEVDPTDLCIFGRTPEGGASVKTLTIRSLGSADLIVEDVSFTEDTSPAYSFIGSMKTPAVVKTQGSDGLPGKLQITIKYTVLVGAPEEARGAVRIRSTDPDQPEVLVPLCGQVNRAPVAVIADVLNAAPGTTVTFDGNGSYDPDNNLPLKYAWRLVRKPSGAQVTETPTGATYALKLDDILPGEYEVELSVTDGDPVQPAISLPPARKVVVAVPAEALRVELFWNNPATDVDLHVLRSPETPLGDMAGDCYYANCRSSAPPLEWGDPLLTDDNPRLSRDALSVYGPEVVGIVEPAPGTYRIASHYFRSKVNEVDEPSTVTVRVYVRGVLRAQLERTLQKAGDSWLVADVAWPAGTVTALP